MVYKEGKEYSGGDNAQELTAIKWQVLQVQRTEKDCTDRC